MADEKDAVLGRIAVERGYVSQEQLDVALEIQRQARDDMGLDMPLVQVLVNRHLLTPDQAQELRNAVAVETGEARLVAGYEVVSKLGQGGFGAVYRAKQAETGKFVALKILPPSLATPDLVKRFERESEIVRRLDHQNIVACVEFGYDPKRKVHFCALELVEGEDLAKRIGREGVLPEAEALSVTKQVAMALQHAFFNGLVHRDVKPENIMVTPDGTAKLLDLGLARPANAEATRLTQTGMFVGSAYYASPEQAKSESGIDTRSDIYSLGATLYHMITGKPPFQGSNVAHVLYQQAYEKLVWPAEVNPELSDGICRVIAKMLAKDPAERYQTPNELLRDIDVLEEGGEPDVADDALRNSSIALAVRPRKKRKRPASAPRHGRAREAAAPAVAAARADHGRRHARAGAPSASGMSPTTKMWAMLGVGAAVFVIGLVAMLVRGEPKRRPDPSPRGGTTTEPGPDEGVSGTSPGGVQQPKDDEGTEDTREPTLPPPDRRPANVPPDAVEFGGHFYKLFRERMTWHDARAFCEKKGGHLVTITSKEENDFATPLVREANASAWIGFSDERREGEWEWVTGEAPAYTAWGAGEPSGAFRGQPESWACISPARAHLWCDIQADARCPFICEWEPAAPLAKTMNPASTLTLDLGGGVTMELVYIKPGRFVMGGDEDPREAWQGVEKPKHEVSITRGFYIGKYEVTQSQYEALVGGNPSERKGPNRPVERVTWNDAADFCRLATGRARRQVRLPTEAEWEYACRAGTTGTWCFGSDDDTLDDYAWCVRNSGGFPHPVGQKKPNAWGLCDMHGNAWEWCADWYSAAYYANSPRQNPTGPQSGDLHVMRGGSCENSARSAIRLAKPVARYRDHGFRVAVTATPGETGALPTGGDLTRGLVGWWKFDETGGTIARDSSGKGNHGTLKNMSGNEWAQGKLGGALRFDGDNDYILVPDESAFDFTEQMTVSAWIEVASFTKEWQAIVNKGDYAWRLQRFEKTDQVGFGIGHIPHVEPHARENVNDGRWHHVAGVYDRRELRVYIDGRLGISERQSKAIDLSDAPVWIGGNSFAENERNFHGLIDDVRIYERALSAEEIKLLAHPEEWANAERAPPSATMAIALLLAEFDALMSKGDHAGARKYAEAEAAKPANAAHAKLLQAAARVAKALETRPAAIRKGAEALVGKEVRLKLATDSMTATVKAVSDAGLAVTTRFTINNETREKPLDLDWDALHAEQRAELARLGGVEMSPSDAAVALAYGALASGDLEAAEATLSAKDAADHPLAEYLKGRVAKAKVDAGYKAAMDRARARIRSKDWKGAVEPLEEALAVKPDDAEAAKLLAEAESHIDPLGVPPDAVEFGGHRYKLYRRKMTWHDAKAFCEKQGGHLVTITTKEENDFAKGIARRLPGKSGSVWMGLTDEHKESDWRWVTGEKVAFTDWARWQPDNGRGVEDYGAISDWDFGDGHSFEWNDVAPDTLEFICEWDAEKVGKPGETLTLDLGGGVTMELVHIEPGTFVMGDDAGKGGVTFGDEAGKDNEKPAHAVVITKGYYIGKYEVTCGQFAAFVEATGYRTGPEQDRRACGRRLDGKWGEIAGASWRDTTVFRQTDDHPVTCVSWDDARAFCDWMAKKTGQAARLPTEAEWEYACRAGSTGRYCFGSRETGLGEHAWFEQNSGRQTHPVGEKRPNAWGLYDMHGNVWEWVEDWYAADYYAKSPREAPPGPQRTWNHPYRGGAWSVSSMGCRSAMRHHSEPSHCTTDKGFRVAVTAVLPKR